MTQAAQRTHREIFRPKGERAEWRLLYDEFRKHDAGQVVTYERLSEVLGRDFHGNRTPVQRAMKELENADHRTLVCERGTGYRIAAATEHEHLARVHSQRSRRQLGKAVAKARSANRAELTVEQARRLDDLEAHLSEHAGMLARLDERDRQREAQLKELRRDTSTDIAAIDDKFTRLTELLNRHGIDTSAVLAPAGTGRPAR
jgi:septal ring factor EnvC (AmiA/AmiB activator)